MQISQPTRMAFDQTQHLAITAACGRSPQQDAPLKFSLRHTLPSDRCPPKSALGSGVIHFAERQLSREARNYGAETLILRTRLAEKLGITQPDPAGAEWAALRRLACGRGEPHRRNDARRVCRHYQGLISWTGTERIDRQLATDTLKESNDDGS